MRLLVLVLTLPLILHRGLRRFDRRSGAADVRRFGAGRESGLHLPPRESAADAAGRAAVGHLPALPISVHPLVILLPSAALLGLAVSLTAGSFKSTSKPSIRSSAGSYCLRPKTALISTINPLLIITGMARWWLRFAAPRIAACPLLS